MDVKLVISDRQLLRAFVSRAVSPRDLWNNVTPSHECIYDLLRRRMPISPYIASLRRRVGSELLLLPSVTGVIYDAESRVMLVRNSADALWSTPGGVMELDETPMAAVIREVREETGLDVDVVRLMGVFGGPAFVVDYPNGHRTQYVSSIFECRVVGGTPAPDGDETDALTFVGPREFEELQCAPWIRHVMPHLFRRDATAFFQ